MPKRNVIVIGASAGGVEALCELNKHLPKHLDASVFVVMHIGIETLLPQILTRCGKLPAVIAEHGKQYQRGCIYCAPAQYHLSLKDHTTVLTRVPRENGHRPAIDVLFRSAAREHRSKVIGVVLGGGRDDGSAGLFAIKARGGVAIVQDPKEAITPNMPQNALNMVDVDFCVPVRQIAEVLVQLANGKATDITESPNGESTIEDQATAERPTSAPGGAQIPVACSECNGPLYEVKDGELAHFQCFVGHRFSPESLSEQHTEALERALWTATRKLKERVVLHKALFERKKRNKGEDELMKRLKNPSPQPRAISSCCVKFWSGFNGLSSLSYDAVADLMARRSSIRSRSTSQYLRAESRSLSGGSPSDESLRSIIFRPESFAAFCSLRVDFARRHLPRRRRAAPVTIVPSFVLSAFNSDHNSGTAVIKSFRASNVSTAAKPRKFRNLIGGAVLCAPRFSTFRRLAQMHREGLLRLYRKTGLLVRRTRSNHVLRVECAERCLDSGPDPDDALFQAWPKHGDPKLAAKKQLGNAHRGRASGMSGAIKLHLFDRRRSIIHHPAPTRSVVVLLHLPVERAPCKDWM